MPSPTTTPAAPFTRDGHSYTRAPMPLHFPEHEQVPESKLHLELRTLLYQVLKIAFGSVHAIGCDQFVYWDAADPRRCLAPDGFVRLNADNDTFRVWKVWERGAPHVAVEIVSATERDVDLNDQLARYRQMGVAELVRFDCEDNEHPLRVWDRIDDDLVERSLNSPAEAPSTQLPVIWAVVEDPELGPSLRPLDSASRQPFSTPTERAEAERRRADEAERRLRELEAQLARK